MNKWLIWGKKGKRVWMNMVSLIDFGLWLHTYQTYLKNKKERTPTQVHVVKLSSMFHLVIVNAIQMENRIMWKGSELRKIN